MDPARGQDVDQKRIRFLIQLEVRVLINSGTDFGSNLELEFRSTRDPVSDPTCGQHFDQAWILDPPRGRNFDPNWGPMRGSCGDHVCWVNDMRHDKHDPKAPQRRCGAFLGCCHMVFQIGNVWLPYTNCSCPLAGHIL